MKISCIVATADKNVIGKNNDIPWYLPADLQYFKKVTSGHHIIMGRKCYSSIGRPLPKRTNVIITRDPYFISTGCVVTHSIHEALERAHDNGEKEAFIIGGGTIYEQTVELWDRLYLPKLDLDQWELISAEAHKADGKNEHDYVFKVYDRK